MEEFDYIVIGAGSAGAAVAARLSENPKTSVLLIEAGRADHPWTRFPISFGLLINNPAANWVYESEPEPGTANRAIPVPRGKLLGGSSAINGLVWVRGQPLDYDTWAQMGARGWSWQDVAPLFQRIENFEDEGAENRGKGGPLTVTRVPDENPLYGALFKGAQQAGYRFNPDYNGEDQEGISKTQASISRGRRMSVARCYLDPAMKRPNLKVVTEAPLRRIVLEGKRCTGVIYERWGRQIEAKARGEVVLSAGGVASSQLLELSGIGNPEILKAHGVEVHHALPAVGENLRDHIAARIVWRAKDPSVSYNARSSGVRSALEFMKVLTAGRGFFSIPSAPLLAFLKSRPELATPDIQLHLLPYAVKDLKRRKLHPFPAFAMTCYQLRPESLGSIHIRSADPDAHPRIIFNFFADSIDRQTMADGFRMMRRIAGAPAMEPFRGEEVSPGADVKTDEQAIDWMRKNSQTAYHPIGTCRMGEGPNSVVNARLKVHGLEGLRVADSSIFPTMPSGNTNAPAIMVGEKAADMIREDARAK